MFRRSSIVKNRGGHTRAFMHQEPALRFVNNLHSWTGLTRSGQRPQRTGGAINLDTAPYQHAFPLLSHDNFGHNDHANDTTYVELGMYMPKRNKGTAPWFRGSETYSLKYSEQGRYEYQRYLLISRFPSEYKRKFQHALAEIKKLPKKDGLVAIHVLHRLLVDNYNPQHVHYIAAMEKLMECSEYDAARDVWKMLERQQVWPCDKTIATYLELCFRAKEKTWAMECWNRYCTEKAFLKVGETDPKPVTRVPFSLNREELLYLPKWKKHFEHDPNMDVLDLNRFNTTRNIYHKMALTMLSSGDMSMFEQIFSILEAKLLESQTPIPEPPNPQFNVLPVWSPFEEAETFYTGAWRPQNTSRVHVLGPSNTTTDSLPPRFFSNEQFLVHCVGEYIDALVNNPPQEVSPATRLQTCKDLVIRLQAKVGAKLGSFSTDVLFAKVIQAHRELGGMGGDALVTLTKFLLDEKSKIAQEPPEALVSGHYFEILKGFALESRKENRTSRFDPRKVMQQLATVTKEMSMNHDITWGADMHLCIIETMVHCGTMAANQYFTKHVLRRYKWDCKFLEVLYEEYRRHRDVDMWAELTKRALVWTARYDVVASEELKRMIEDDYETIQVQTRTFTEVAVFQFRDVEEKRAARDPVNQLPNPWMDYVSHALAFPDRDTGYPDHYGDLGQWQKTSPNPNVMMGKYGMLNYDAKGPRYQAPDLHGEHLKGYTAEWRDPTNKNRPPPLPAPWNDKYKKYEHGQHPCYDQIYAGPFPVVHPTRQKFRPKTRWDFQDVQKQSKFKISGPY